LVSVLDPDVEVVVGRLAVDAVDLESGVRLGAAPSTPVMRLSSR
jgi:hypothetical protein